MVSHTIAAGTSDAATTLYSYQWDAGLLTTGLPASGGWLKSTTHVSGHTASESSDYFGRTVERTDLGGRSYTFGFDKGGRLVSQTSSSGPSLAYTYYNTGRLKGIDEGTTAQTRYGYDRAGNRTFESYVTGIVNGSGGVSRQNATATYDMLNRVISINDSGAAAANAVDIDYEYDKVGNVRRVTSNYWALDQYGNASSAASKDHWYKYDSMNRFTTTMGTLSGSTRRARR